LVGFGLGAFAAATAVRALVLSVRATRAHHVGWWRGLIGRTNGGMVVHLGVIVLAVGVIAATAYRQQSELTLRQGQTVAYDGHTFEFLGLKTVVTPSKTSDEALVKVDGGTFTPATTNFGGALATVGTPAIDSGVFGDVYLTFDEVGGLGATSGGSIVQNLPAGSVVIGVVIEPLVAWLWTGGLLVGLGGLLALAPGSRRRATDPVSAPSAMVAGREGDAPQPEREKKPENSQERGEDAAERQVELTPVGRGAAIESGAPSA
jgi:cytochrome c-type biogenesis protein CcmF